MKSGKQNVPHVIEPQRKTPVSHEADVVVCGAGTAGIAAAVCAAREGLSVVLVERSSLPGGMITHVTSWFSDFDNKGGFVREFIEHLKREGIVQWPYYNPWLVIPYLDMLIKAHGIRVLYLADAVAPLIEEGKLRGVFVESKSGRTAILAKIIVDATGDGDIAARAGAKYEMGNRDQGAMQAISITQLLMNYTGGTIAVEKMRAIITQASSKSGKSYWYPYDMWHPEKVVGTKNALFQNIPHVTGYDPTNVEELSDAIIEARGQAYELYELLKSHTDVFKTVEFGPFGAIPGVRESRRIVCDAMVTKETVLSGGRFDDGLFTVTQAIDIHRRNKSEPCIMCEDVRPYHFPYRALLPRGLDNMLVVGRCAGGDHEALASYRIIANCMAMGEAAALAAKSAVTMNCQLRDVPAADVVRAMSSRGYAR